MEKDISLTIRYVDGQHRISLPASSSLADLRAKIFQVTGVSGSNQQLLTFPANPIVSEDDSVSLSSLGIKGGALVLKGEKSAPSSSHGKLIRRIVDADNSCLFTSFSYLLENKTRSKQQQFRKIVADTVLQNQELYSKAVLNQEPKQYAEWILTSTAWGGSIDIAILSEHFKVEVCVFDIQVIFSICGSLFLLLCYLDKQSR